MSMILNLVKPDSGSYQWFGKAPSKESRKRIGSVIESPNFYPYLSAVRNLQIVAKIKGISYHHIDEVLKTTGLYERRHSQFRTFSFGMKQRLALASALLGDPELMILDEPTNGLDPQGIVHIRDIILDVASKGTTIILASHLLDEVQKICTDVTVLQKGKKLFSGKVDEVLAVTDCIEIDSDDPVAMARHLEGIPGYKSHLNTDGTTMVYFDKAPSSSSINSYFHERGIVLSHLSNRKRTLEQHFLELLADNK